jgi:hypothetical protein
MNRYCKIVSKTPFTLTVQFYYTQDGPDVLHEAFECSIDTNITPIVMDWISLGLRAGIDTDASGKFIAPATK